MGQYKPLLGSLSQQYLCQIKSTQMASNLSIWSLVLFTLCFISCTGYINFSLQPALPSALCWNNTEPVTLMEAPRLQTSPSTAVLSFLVHCTGIEQIPEIQTFTELFVRALCTVQAHESTCDINAAWFKWLGRVSFICDIQLILNPFLHCILNEFTRVASHVWKVLLISLSHGPLNCF